MKTLSRHEVLSQFAWTCPPSASCTGRSLRAVKRSAKTLQSFSWHGGASDIRLDQEDESTAMMEIGTQTDNCLSAECCSMSCRMTNPVVYLAVENFVNDK